MKMLYLVQVSIQSKLMMLCKLYYIYVYAYVGPPSAPRNLNHFDVTNTTVFLQWDYPLDNGNRLDLFYTISENISNVNYDATNTSFLLENLIPFVNYEIRVTADNGVSSQDPDIDKRTVSVQIMTKEGSTYVVVVS